MREVLTFSPEEIHTGTSLLSQLVGGTDARVLSVDPCEFDTRLAQLRELRQFCTRLLLSESNQVFSMFSAPWDYRGKLYLGAWCLGEDILGIPGRVNTPQSFYLYQLAEIMGSQMDSSARVVTSIWQKDQAIITQSLMNTLVLSKINSYMGAVSLVRYAQGAYAYAIKLGEHNQPTQRLKLNSIVLLTAVHLTLEILMNERTEVGKILTEIPRDYSERLWKSWVATQTRMFEERGILR